MQTYLLAYDPNKLIPGVSIGIGLSQAMVALYNSGDILLAAIYGLLVAIILYFASMLTLTRQQPANAVYLSRNGSFLSAALPGRFIWKWHPLLNYRVISASELRSKITHNVRPVTANPKVLDLQFGIEAVFRGDPDSAIAFHQAFPGGQEEAGRWLHRQLFVFANQENLGLAQFNNPLEEELQIKFIGLLTRHFEPLIAGKGIKLKYFGFQDRLNPPRHYSPQPLRCN